MSEEEKPALVVIGGTEAAPVTPEVRIGLHTIISGVVAEILLGLGNRDTDVATVAMKFKRLSDGFIGDLTEKQFERVIAAVMVDCGWRQYSNQKSRWYPLAVVRR